MAQTDYTGNELKLILVISSTIPSNSKTYVSVFQSAERLIIKSNDSTNMDDFNFHFFAVKLCSLCISTVLTYNIESLILIRNYGKWRSSWFKRNIYLAINEWGWVGYEECADRGG